MFERANSIERRNIQIIKDKKLRIKEYIIKMMISKQLH
jgi:hypothetical protein